MRRALASPWAFRLWIALVVLAQTSWAGVLADGVVRYFLPPGPRPGGWIVFAAQKGLHVVLFGGVGALLALGGARLSLARVAAWCVGFGACAEALQMLAPNRHPALSDALLNIAAALAAYALMRRAAGPDSRRESPAPPRR